MELENDIAGDEVIDLNDPANMPEERWNEWQKEHPNSFIHQVQKGRLGHNKGMHNGMVAINNYIYGTHKARYYLIGADSGVGKTTVSDFMFVLRAWESAKEQGRNISIFYCSFEISKLAKQAKWCSYYIFMKHGIELPSEYILGSIEGKYLSDDEMRKVKEAYVKIELIMKDIIFLEDAVHPTAIFEGLISSHYEKVGTVERTPVSAEDRKKGKKGFIKGYTPNNPEDICLLVVDHLALVGTEMGLDLKRSIDKLSRYFVILRNMFSTTVIAIQQFSTDLLQAKRDKALSATGAKQSSMITPNRLDFGDSKTTYRDADVVIGLVKPADFELADFQGYNLAEPKYGGLGGYFLVMYLMKHRQGRADKKFAIFINYVAGICYDLPQEIDQMDQWYEKAEKLDQLCLLYSPNND